MAELFFVKLVDWPIQLLEQLQPFRGDAGFDDAAVLCLALAGDEFVLFHAIEKPRNVRIARDHAFADTAAEETIGLRATENAKNIVLRGGKAGGFNELFGRLRKGIGALEDGNEEVVFEVGCGARRISSGIHPATIVVVTTIVKRKISEPLVSPERPVMAC